MRLTVLPKPSSRHVASRSEHDFVRTISCVIHELVTSPDDERPTTIRQSEIRELTPRRPLPPPVAADDGDDRNATLRLFFAEPRPTIVDEEPPRADESLSALLAVYAERANRTAALPVDAPAHAPAPAARAPARARASFAVGPVETHVRRAERWLVEQRPPGRVAVVIACAALSSLVTALLVR